MGWLENVYGKALNWSVNHRKTFLFGALALFVAVIVGIGPMIKTEFFPTQDNGRIAVKIKLPIGTRQEITRDLALRIDKQFRTDYPEIIAIGMSEGTADTDNTFASMQENGTHYISMNIRPFRQKLRNKLKRV